MQLAPLAATAEDYLSVLLGDRYPKDAAAAASSGSGDASDSEASRKDAIIPHWGENGPTDRLLDSIADQVSIIDTDYQVRVEYQPLLRAGHPCLQDSSCAAALHAAGPVHA